MLTLTSIASCVQVVMVVAVLYYYIGPSVFAGVVTLLLLVPLNSYIANSQQRLNRSNLKYKDERLRLTNEVLSGMKVRGKTTATTDYQSSFFFFFFSSSAI